MTRIRITTGAVSAEAELNDGPTAQAIAAALPITARGNTWGDEIYFGIPVEMEREADARAEMVVGELAYWPAGNAFCIFFGPTPASSGEAPVAASPCNVVGRVVGDATVFRGVSHGTEVRIEAIG